MNDAWICRCGDHTTNANGRCETCQMLDAVGAMKRTIEVSGPEYDALLEWLLSKARTVTFEDDGIVIGPLRFVANTRLVAKDLVFEGDGQASQE